MEAVEQINVGRALLALIECGTTAMADTVYQQPVSEYMSENVAAAERDKLFGAQAQCLGFSGLLPVAGSYCAHAESGRPLLLTRAEDGKFRAFLNVCRHRGSMVTTGCGRDRQLRCPYHAWAYGLDGTLQQRPHDGAFAEIPRQQLSLTEVPAAEYQGMLWVGGSHSAISPQTFLGGLDRELSAYELDKYQLYCTRRLSCHMNWKLVMDTFFESYHFSALHRDSIAPIFHSNLTTFDAFGDHFRLVAARRTIQQLHDQPESDWDLLPHIAAIYVLFPNVVVVWQGDHFELWEIYPDPERVDSSVARLSLYVGTSADSDSARRYWDRNLDLVLRTVEEEDFVVGEATQKGFATGAQAHFLFGRNEPALAHYHRAVTRTLTTR